MKRRVEFSGFRRIAAKVRCPHAKTSCVRRNVDPQLLPRTPNHTGLVARRDWTRQWWNEAPSKYELLTSPAVINELSAGIPERSAQRLSLIRDLPILPIEPAITDIAAAYIQQKVMPADPTGDALHLAIASFHKCDFLVTWNCQHIANANKFGHIRRVNNLLGLFVPALVTPLELLGVDHEPNDP